MIYRFLTKESLKNYSLKITNNEKVYNISNSYIIESKSSKKGKSILHKKLFSTSDNISNNKDDKNDIIAVSFEDVFLLQDKIKSKVKELINKTHKVNLVIDGCSQFDFITPDQRIEYNFDIETLRKFNDFNTELKQLGLSDSIKFNEFFLTTKYSDLKTCWNLEQVIDANNELESIVNRIKKLNLSPYEIMVYIHKYLTDNFMFGYNVIDCSRTRKSEKNRSIIGAIKYSKTMCAGFASLTKAIVDKLNSPNLKCNYLNAIVLKRETNKVVSGHSLNLVSIKDEKYNIDGSYINDCSSDSSKKPFFSRDIHILGGKGYAFFMYPVEDLEKTGKINQIVSEGSRAITFINTNKTSNDLFQLKNGESTPISYKKFEKAIKTVYSLEKKFCKGRSPNMMAMNDIQLSLQRAYNSRIDNLNPLVKQAEKIYKMKMGILGSTKCKLKPEEAKTELQKS